MIRYQPEKHLGLIAKVEEHFGDKLLGRAEKSHYHQFSLRGEDGKALVKFLKEDPDLRFTYFIDLAGIDYLKFPQPQAERFAIQVVLLSPSLGIKVQVRIFASANTPQLPTLSDLFPGADWTEREVWDLYGIEFLGHPDLKRILLPEDYEGHPLRKDYPLRGRGERGNFPVYHAVPIDQAPAEDR
jgi:NADH-quinone oxidoreductase subunit C